MVFFVFCNSNISEVSIRPTWEEVVVASLFLVGSVRGCGCVAISIGEKERPSESGSQHPSFRRVFCIAAVLALPTLPKKTGEEAEGGACDGSDVADPKDEFSVADRFHGPDLFEL